MKTMLWTSTVPCLAIISRRAETWLRISPEVRLRPAFIDAVAQKVQP
jgi:hypothetical protein